MHQKIIQQRNMHQKIIKQKSIQQKKFRTKKAFSRKSCSRKACGRKQQKSICQRSICTYSQTVIYQKKYNRRAFTRKAYSQTVIYQKKFSRKAFTRKAYSRKAFTRKASTLHHLPSTWINSISSIDFVHAVLSLISPLMVNGECVRKSGIVVQMSFSKSNLKKILVGRFLLETCRTKCKQCSAI